MTGEDPQRLAVFGDNALSNAADALADLLSGHDPQLASGKLLHEHRGARGIALALVTPASVTPGRYKPPDAVLAFLEGLG